jgi:hypothetical protein
VRFADQGFEKGPPGLLRYHRVLVRENDDSHAVLTAETRQLSGEADRMSVAPTRPKTALGAVAAEMRTTARELHDDRTQPRSNRNNADVRKQSF